MNDLFEKLKAEPPVKIFKKSTVKRINDDIDESPLATPPPPRCMSTPPSSPSLVSAAIVKEDEKSIKSDIRSPPKHVNPFRLRSLQIRIKRNNLNEIRLKVPTQKTVTPDVQKLRKRKASQDASSSCGVETRTPTKRTKSSKNETEEDSSLKTTPTPTKAKQKIFESSQQKHTQPKLKRCYVRVQRLNLLELQQMVSKQTISKDTSRISSVVKTDCAKTIEPTKKTSAMINATLMDSPLNHSISKDTSCISSVVKIDCEKTIEPTKKTSAMSNATLMDRPLDQSTDSKQKQKRSFFIKLPSTPIKKPESKGDERQIKSVERAKSTRNASALKTHSEPDQAAHCHLVNTFGKRFFAAHVRIQRCRHPLMLTIESNERARKWKTRQSKTKNLSVSFKETVEVLGDDEEDTDEDYQETERHPIFPPGQIDLRELYLGHVRSPPEKKMENGNDTDDDALDASLTETIVNTSIVAAGRKRLPRKSYSPLKDDTTPSPRRERLKLANEKVPPEGMLLINTIDDDDDEEYIVPDVLHSGNIELNKVPASVEGDESKPTEPANTNGTALDTSKSDSEESFRTELVEVSISAQVENGQESNSKIEQTAISKRKVMVTTAIDVDDEMSAKANSDDESQTNVNDDHLSKMVEDNLPNKDLNQSPNDDAGGTTFKLPKKTAYKSAIKVNERESPHNDKHDATSAKICFDVRDDETTTNGLTKIPRDGGTDEKKDVVPSSPHEIDADETAPRDITSSPQEIKDDETIPRIVFLSLQEISDDDTAANDNSESDQVIIDDETASKAVLSTPVSSPPEIYDVISTGNLSESPQKVNDNETGMKGILESPKSVNDDENVENKKAYVESAGNSSSSYVSAEEIQHLHDLLSADQDSPNPADVSTQLLDDNQSVENLAVSETDELTNCALIGSAHVAGTVHSNNRSSSIERELSLHLFVEDEENESVDEIVKDTINKLGQDIELEDDRGSQPHVGDDDDNPPSMESHSSEVY